MHVSSTDRGADGDDDVEEELDLHVSRTMAPNLALLDSLTPQRALLDSLIPQRWVAWWR